MEIQTVYRLANKIDYRNNYNACLCELFVKNGDFIVIGKTNCYGIPMVNVIKFINPIFTNENIFESEDGLLIDIPITEWCFFERVSEQANDFKFNFKSVSEEIRNVNQ